MRRSILLIALIILSLPAYTRTINNCKSLFRHVDDTEINSKLITDINNLELTVRSEFRSTDLHEQLQRLLEKYRQLKTNYVVLAECLNVSQNKLKHLILKRDQLKEELVRLEFESRHDELTGLPNRYALNLRAMFL